MSFSQLFVEAAHNPLLLTAALLTMGVVFVNGWTDAPNAIATCISTRAISPRGGIAMAAAMNFCGVFAMTAAAPRVAATIYHMVDFGENTHAAAVALCAALAAIVVWAVAAWWFGIPTSESHALIAGLSGAAVALQGGRGINAAEWRRVVWGLALSVLLSFVGGFLVTHLFARLFKSVDRQRSHGAFCAAQNLSAAATAFMHGAQDGQKFIGVFLLGVSLAQGNRTDSFAIPTWLMLLCSVTMGLGTSVGGERIIKAIGVDMIKLQPYQGVAADLSAAGCLLLCSLFGLPVSTTNAKAASIMGVGAAGRLSAVKWGVAREILIAWALTFPGCGLLGYTFTQLAMRWL